MTTDEELVEKCLLTDIEMAEVQGDKERCLAVIGAFDTCRRCSANCHSIAKGQLTKAIPIIRKAVAEEIIKEQNIPIRYDHNATCYDCLERIRAKYCGKPSGKRG